MFRGTLRFYVHTFFYLHNLKKVTFSITVSVYNREVHVYGQRGYRFLSIHQIGY